MNCPGGLIVHVDQTVAGCTEDHERDGCAGLELRHEADPHRCFEWWGRCDYCGIHSRHRRRIAIAAHTGNGYQCVP